MSFEAPLKTSPQKTVPSQNKTCGYELLNWKRKGLEGDFLFQVGTLSKAQIRQLLESFLHVSHHQSRSIPKKWSIPGTMLRQVLEAETEGTHWQGECPFILHLPKSAWSQWLCVFSPLQRQPGSTPRLLASGYAPGTFVCDVWRRSATSAPHLAGDISDASAAAETSSASRLEQSEWLEIGNLTKP